MVNVLNTKIAEEYSTLFNEADDFLVVNCTGLTVEEVNALRASLTENDIHMKVVKTSIARHVLKEQERGDCEELVQGPIAVVWGGEGIVQVSKSVDAFVKKAKKKNFFKGALLGMQIIDVDGVKRLTQVPDRPVLLGSIVGAFMDPLQSFGNGVSQLLGNIANLVDALEKKRTEEGAQG